MATNKAEVTADYFISRIHFSDGRVANICDTTSNFIKYIRINGTDVPIGSGRDRLYLKLNGQNIAPNIINIEEPDVDGVIQNRQALSIDQTFQVNGTTLVNKNQTRSDNTKTSVINQTITVNNEKLANVNDASNGSTNMKIDIKVNDTTLKNTNSNNINVLHQKVKINGKQLTNAENTDGSNIIQQGFKFNSVQLNNENEVIHQKLLINGTELTNSKKGSGTNIYNQVSQNIQVNGVQLQNKNGTMNQEFIVNGVKLVNTPDTTNNKNTITQTIKVNDVQLDNTNGIINQKFKVNGVQLDNTSGTIEQTIQVNGQKLTNTNGTMNQVVKVNNKQLTNNNDNINLHIQIDGVDETITTTNNQEYINLTKSTTSKYGVTKLSSAINSDSEDVAATPKAVKTVASNANTALQEYKNTMASKTTIADYGITDAKITEDASGNPIITLGDKIVKPVTSDSGNVPLSNIDNADELKKIETLAENGGDGLLQRTSTGDWNFTTSAGTGTIQAVAVHNETIATSGTANIPDATTSKYGATKLASKMVYNDESLALDSKAILNNYIMLSETKPTSSQVKGEFWYEILPDED